VFAFAGEGAHSTDTDPSILRASPAWEPCKLQLALQGVDLDELFEKHLGEHLAPHSPIVTTVINVCLCELWKLWGFVPTHAVGHSIGELAAVYCAGLYSLGQALGIAIQLGDIASRVPGAMLLTTLPKIDAYTLPQDGPSLAAVNNVVPGTDNVQVSLCGTEEQIAAWLRSDPNATKLHTRHPWHHPSYRQVVTNLDSKKLDMISRSAPSSQPASCRVWSPSKGTELFDVNGSHWVDWLSSPVELSETVECLRTHALEKSVRPVVIDIGAHPVMSALVHNLNPSHVATSMCRKQPGVQWILEQRELALKTKGSSNLLREAFNSITVKVAGKERTLDLDIEFSAQGITSVGFVELLPKLEPFFPGILPHDLYRFTTIDALITQFGKQAMHESSVAVRSVPTVKKAGVVGVGLCLPGDVNTCDQLWETIKAGEDAVIRGTRASEFPGKKYVGGYLTPAAFSPLQVATRFGIDAAEAQVVDPQQILALFLVEQMWADAGAQTTAAAMADPTQVGVYIGAWQPHPPASSAASAYKTLGGSLSAVAARVANHWDLQGPALTLNTACSSALVAVDIALKDLRSGRVAYAIVGGVNLLDESVTADLRRASFLSPTGRCHTFEEAADGYVRSEGGVMMLLRAEDVSEDSVPGGSFASAPARAYVVGSGVNQNRRSRPMTAVDPVAQERVVRSACADAGVEPTQLAAVECHGTGTKIGDPVELTALAATVGARGRSGKCYLTAAKKQFGHLESAAGALGLLKAVLMAQRGRCVGGAVTKINAAVESAISGSELALAGPEGVALAPGALVGVSSFGFAGNNAHVIVQATGGASKRAGGTALTTVKGPLSHTATRAANLLVQHADVNLRSGQVLETVSAKAPAASKQFGSAELVSHPVGKTSEIGRHSAVVSAVWSAVESVCQEAAAAKDVTANLFDLGVDSLAIAELVIILEEAYGEGCVSIDEVLEDPTVQFLASRISKVSGVAPPAEARQERAAAQMLPVTRSAPASHQEVKGGQSTVQLVWAACDAVIEGMSARSGNDDNLFDAGMDSLAIAELVIKLEEVFGEGAIEIDTVLDEPTVLAIATSLGGAVVTSAPVLPVAQRTAAKLPSAVATPPSAPAMAPKAAPSVAIKAVVSDSDQSMWIQTTHVGSLPREDGSSLEKVVKQQIAAGVSLINDGEYARENYVSDLLMRLDGVGEDPPKPGSATVGDAPPKLSACSCIMPCAADMAEVPLYSKRFTGGNGLITLNPQRVAPLTWLACARQSTPAPPACTARFSRCLQRLTTLGTPVSAPSTPRPPLAPWRCSVRTGALGTTRRT